MPSSTSSSNSRIHLLTSAANSPKGLWREWTFGIALALCLLIGLEAHWRSKAILPNLLDDARLWSAQRERVASVESPVVLLGTSRMAIGFSKEEFKKIYPNRTVINLAFDGSFPMATLRDLSEDPTFHGEVLADAMIWTMLEKNWNTQQQLVDYYHHHWNPVQKFGRDLDTCMQSNLRVVCPDVSLNPILGSVFLHKPIRQMHIHENQERWEHANFSVCSQAELDKMKVTFAPPGKTNPSISPEEVASFHHDVAVINTWIDKIQRRGGRVAFVPFKMTDRIHDHNEAMFPRELYWDYFAKNTHALTLHSDDVAEFGTFACPDSSHLDMRDKARYTGILLRKLEQNGVFNPGKQVSSL